MMGIEVWLGWVRGRKGEMKSREIGWLVVGGGCWGGYVGWLVEMLWGGEGFYLNVFIFIVK